MAENYIRKRRRLLNINVYPEEKDEINRRVYLTGRDKVDYMIQSAKIQKCYVLGNRQLVCRINERLHYLIPRIEKIASGEKPQESDIEELRIIFELTESWEYKL